MTRVDHTSTVPALDAADRARLAHALDRPEVLTAYLIGSQARRTAGPLSDIDIAVLHSPTLPGEGAVSLRLELARDAGAALGTTEVDLVLLNEASPLLRHRVFRDGELLLDNDPSARISCQVAALRDYLDTAPLRAQLRRGLRRRLREDCFGRRREN